MSNTCYRRDPNPPRTGVSGRPTGGGGLGGRSRRPGGADAEGRKCPGGGGTPDRPAVRSSLISRRCRPAAVTAASCAHLPLRSRRRANGRELAMRDPLLGLRVRVEAFDQIDASISIKVYAVKPPARHRGTRSTERQAPRARSPSFGRCRPTGRATLEP